MTEPRIITSKDNQVDVPPAEIIADLVDSALKQFQDLRDQRIAAAGRVEVIDQDTTGRAGDLKAMIATLNERVRNEIYAIAEPHDQAVKLARARMERWLEPLLAASSSVNEKIENYRSAERKRIAEQKRKQREEEQAALAKNAPKEDEGWVSSNVSATPEEPIQVKLAPVRGDFGSLTSDRKVLEVEILDPRALPDLVLNHAKVREAMIAAVKDLHKLQKDIPGAKVTSGAKATTRK